MNYLGNVSLLDQPKHGFLCSRCTRSSVILPCLDWAVERVHGNDVVMSTFHSEMEQAVLDILLSGKCPIILVLGRRQYKEIPEKLKPLLNSNRLLILSLSEEKRISRGTAYECNKFICQQSNQLTFGFLAHGSSLMPLYEQAVQSGIPTRVLTNM